MYTRLADVKLKSGETVEAGVVQGPDPQWCDRVQPLLGHKGSPWQWQIEKLLRHGLPIESYFYILHRDGEPFSNILTCEYRGVGLFGHVYTKPEDRRQGATSQLMRHQMEHFRSRGGRMLSLATGFDSPPYRIYAAEGFKGIAPGNGYMTYHRDGQEKFEREFLVPGKTRIELVAWTHWPVGDVLFLADHPGYVRCAPLRMFGRCCVEGPLLTQLRIESERADQKLKPRSAALVQETTGALLGLAVCGGEPTWPDVLLADVYCHPAGGHWSQAPQMLRIALPEDGRRVIAYADDACPQKMTALETAGFKRTGKLPMRVGSGVEVTVFTRA